MANEPETQLQSTDATELIEIASELLSEAGDLSGSSISDLVEYMIDRWPDRQTGGAP